MNILQIHNYYQYSGGEDVVLKNEYELLTSKKHTVLQYLKNNSEISDYSLLQKGKLFYNTSYSKKSYREILKLFKVEKPDVAHVHNTLPLITPAVYYACNELNIPVVQTLHNYRLLCSNAYLFRNGKVCEECIGKSLYHSLKYGCYRYSRIQTFALARMVEKHRKLVTWSTKIDAYIALTNFSKKKIVEGGFPENKIFIKPNFLSNDPGVNDLQTDYFLFAGRLDITKGLHIILNAISNVNESIKILVAGDGPCKSEIQNTSKIKYEGQLTRIDLIKKIHEAIAVIFPSIWYETFGLSIIEAFASGKPVIASNLGAMAELIEDGRTGLLFEPGNSDDLADKINWANEHKEEMRQMGINARKEYEEKYTAERNYKILMDIYEKAIENRRKRS